VVSLPLAGRLPGAITPVLDVYGKQSQMAETLTTIDIDRVQRGKYQARMTFVESDLDDLAQSIREQGLLQPVLVRPTDGGRYELLDGERRWRACKRAGLREIPVIIRTGVTNAQAAAIGLIANLQRADVPAVEQARGLQRLYTEFEMTHEQIALAIGKSRSQVTNTLRLLESPKEVQGLVNTGQLAPSYATLLLPLPEAQQRSLARRAADGKWNRAALQRAIREAQSTAEQGHQKHPDVRGLERELTEGIGAVTTVEEGGPGKGQLVITYEGLDHLDGILDLLRSAVAKRRRRS
jgi:ParB family transcriptional regulator, chromosome partitioning protein